MQIKIKCSSASAKRKVTNCTYQNFHETWNHCFKLEVDNTLPKTGPGIFAKVKKSLYESLNHTELTTWAEESLHPVGAVLNPEPVLCGTLHWNPMLALSARPTLTGFPLKTQIDVNAAKFKTMCDYAFALSISSQSD